MKKKKQRKCYISAKGTRKADYQKALQFRYDIIFTDNLLDADFFVAPRDTEGLNEEQKRDLEKAETLGLDIRFVNSKLLSEEIDPLKLDYEEQIIKAKDDSLEDEFDRELELL